MQIRSLACAQWVKDPMLLWLWCRPAAEAPIRPLAWEPPYATGVALKRQKKKKKEKRKKVKKRKYVFQEITSVMENNKADSGPHQADWRFRTD